MPSPLRSAMRALPRRLAARLGRRGAFLITMGLAVTGTGYGYVAAPPIRRPDQFVVHDLVPFPAWGLAWIAGGLVGLVYAWTTKPGRDRWGFAALIAMPTMQAASYAVSWALVLLGQPGDPRGRFTALIFVAWAVSILIVAAWPEPRRRLPRLEHLEGQS